MPGHYDVLESGWYMVLFPSLVGKFFFQFLSYYEGFPFPGGITQQEKPPNLASQVGILSWPYQSGWVDLDFIR